MPRSRRNFLHFFIFALIFILSTSADATTIQYTVVDVPDIGVGDRWEYRYSVSDRIFDEGFGFSILFDFETVSSIETPPIVNADWDPIALQPDPLLPDDGLYDALSLAADATLADTFIARFVWAGTGTPGSQPFVVFEPGFSTIETGNTVLVPEPSSFLLCALGLILLGSRRNLSVQTEMRK